MMHAFLEYERRKNELERMRRTHFFSANQHRKGDGIAENVSITLSSKSYKIVFFFSMSDVFSERLDARLSRDKSVLLATLFNPHQKKELLAAGHKQGANFCSSKNADERKMMVLDSLVAAEPSSECE